MFTIDAMLLGSSSGRWWWREHSFWPSRDIIATTNPSICFHVLSLVQSIGEPRLRTDRAVCPERGDVITRACRLQLAGGGLVIKAWP